MIPVSVTAACVVTLLVSLVLPLGILLLLAWRNKKQGILPAWLLGAAGFLVTQMMIRLPLLTVLSSQSWFVRLSQENPFLYAFFLAVTAGLFELAGRYGVALILKNKLTWNRSLALGLGHGGIEAMILTGMTYVNNLLYIAMINSGTLFASLGPEVPQELVLQLQSIQTALVTTPAGIFLLAGLERILAMIAHAAMSVLVCWGVHTGSGGKAALICLGIHTLIDLTAGISLLTGRGLSQTAAYGIIYAILTAAAALSVWILAVIRRRWRQSLPRM